MQPTHTSFKMKPVYLTSNPISKEKLNIIQTATGGTISTDNHREAANGALPHVPHHSYRVVGSKAQNDTSGIL